MNKLSAIYLLTLLCLTNTICQGQMIKVEDPIFASFLCEYYAPTMSSTCDSIDISSADHPSYDDGHMRFSNRLITSIKELSSYEYIDTIYGNNNLITCFPKLAQKVDYIDLSNNMISTFEADFLPINSELIHLDLHNNLLQSLPDLSNAKSSIRTLKLNNNNLSSVIDLSNLSALDSLDLSDNNFSFNDLLHFVQLERFNPSTYKLAPQKPKVFPEENFTFNEGENFTYTLSFDSSTTGSTYKWFRDNNLHSTTTENVLEFNNISLEDAGAYTLTITNSYPGLEETEITFENSFNIDVIEKPLVLSPNGDGIGDELYIEEEGSIEILGKSGANINHLTGPVIWNITDSSGKTLEPGIYFILYEDGSYKNISILY